MDVRLEASWKEQLKEEFDKPYFKQLAGFVREAYQSGTVYPPPKCVFNALDAVPFDKVRVVVLGQDPYHGPGQAHGLCFSVPDGVKMPPARSGSASGGKPPSLQNIFKEIRDDLGLPIPESGNLQHWADQGVLLLNATLTVEAAKAGSHQGKGWEEFTDAIVKKLNEHREGLVFLLWGSYAQKKGAHIDRAKHLVLQAPHPSPLSAHNGFFGCRHFSKTNEYLVSKVQAPIGWVKDAPKEIDVRDVNW